VDLDVWAEGAGLQAQAPRPVILLDTNALIWLLQRHQRARQLEKHSRLQMSPASLFELQLLVEAGRLALPHGRTVTAVVQDPRWRLDEPPAGPWFEIACELSWTRDPFDRLLVAHARLRGWKLATADSMLHKHLAPRETLAL
jgi:PIN domain nuclease of toxin-antitoxin system